MGKPTAHSGKPLKGRKMVCGPLIELATPSEPTSENRPTYAGETSLASEDLAGAPVRSLEPEPGRQRVGPLLKGHVPAWVINQLDAIQAERTRARRRSHQTLRGQQVVPRAAVVRDVLIAGLLMLKERGLDAPGFNPEDAIRKAIGRGEHTATVFDKPKPRGCRAPGPSQAPPTS